MTDGPTEAPGTQRDSVLGRWVQENPAKFMGIIENMTVKEREVFFENFFSSLVKGGLNKAAKAD